jgi:hypothetical protein
VFSIQFEGKNMNRSMRLSLVCAALSSALFAGVAQAEVCSNTTTSAAYLGCAGSFTGNINGSASELVQLASSFGGSWSYLGKSDDASFGPFTGNPGTNTGTLTFDSPVYGSFVLGLKSATQYSYFLFDGGTLGVSSVTYDTLGVAQNGNGVAQALGHAALYVSAVPEPGSTALWLAGLLGLSWVSRQRQRAR